MQKKWVYSGLLLLMLCGLTIIPATRFVTGGQNPAAPLQINLFSTHEQNDNHISDNRDSQPPTPTTSSQKITAAPPEIQAILDQITTSGYAGHLTTLANAFGSRMTGQTGNALAVQYIYDFFQEVGLEVSTQVFSGSSPNVIGVLPGGNALNNAVIVVGAHLDSTPYVSPGADDDASGVAAVMMMAQALSQYIYDYSIHFVAFNQEEQGLYGSKAYAGMLDYENITVAAMINFDMIYWDNPDAPANEKIDIIHNGGDSGTFATLAENRGQDWLDAPVTKWYNPHLTMSDHSPFWDRGFPAVWFFERGGLSQPYIHSAADHTNQPDYSYELGTLVAQTAAAAVADFAEIVSTNPGFPQVTFVAPSPPPGYVTPSEDVPIVLQIDDAYNDVNRVELSIDGGEWFDISAGLNATHCTYDWNATEAYGEVQINAHVFDAEGWIGRASHTVLVDLGVSCVIDAPLSGEEILQASQITIWINATDLDGGVISNVFISINGSTESVAQIAIPNSRYYFNWTAAGWGPTTIRARAIDTNGVSNTSEISVTIKRYVPRVFGITYTPLQPFDTDGVSVTAQVVTEELGSALKYVFIAYSVNLGSWLYQRMTPAYGDTYEGTINPLRAGSRVQFYVIAYDLLDNTGQDDNGGYYYHFTVVSNPMPLLLIGGGVVGIIALIVVVWMIRRRRSPSPS